MVGVLNNNSNACPFYEDVHTWKIAESMTDTPGKLNKTWNESLTLSAPVGYDETDYLIEGNYIVFQDHTGRWKEFTIYETKESMTDKGHTKTIQAFNSCVWNMNHIQLEEKQWTGGVKSQAIFEYIFSRSGWRLSDFSEFYKGERKEYTVSSGTAQAALVSALKEFEVEAQAYVVLENGQIVDHVVELAQPIGRKTALRFEYKRNLTGCTRTISDTEFYTKLYVFGGADKDGKPTTITDVNDKKPFLIDEEANDKYNGGREYLEGVVTNESILNKNGLLEWGKEQFKYYNHPKCTYEVDIALLDDDVQIGDEIVVVDREFSPSLQVLARVVETSYSISNPQSNKVLLGEFVSLENVTPDLIWQLKAQLEQELNKIKSWKIVIENLGEDEESQGKSTLLQAKVYYGEELMNSKIPANGVKWYERSYDTPNDEYIFIGTGFIIRGYYGREYKAELSDEIKDMIETTFYPLEEKNFKFECRLSNNPNAEGLLPSIKADFNTNIHQYVEVLEDNYYWLQNYTGKDHNSKIKAESYTITKTDKTGKILGRIKCINCCHGDEFSLTRTGDGKLSLYTPWYDPTQKEWTLSVLEFKDEDFLNDKAFHFKDARSMFRYYPSWQPRLSRDKTTGNFIVQRGRGENPDRVSIWDFSVEGEGQDLYLDDTSAFQITNFNLSKSAGMDDTDNLQSVSMRYPYIYAAYGRENADTEGVNDSDQPTILCYDCVGNKVLWKLVFNFKDSIKPLKEGSLKKNLETINYSLIDNKYMNIFVSFDFEGEREGDPRVGILYKIIQTASILEDESTPFRCTRESYYQKAMEEMVERVKRERFSEDDKVIIFDTDSHLQYNTFRTYGDIEALSEKQIDSFNVAADFTRLMPVDMIILGGDVVDGSGLSAADTKDALTDVKRIISKHDERSDYIYAIGNHDYNGFFAQASARSRLANKKNGKPKNLSSIVLSTKDITNIMGNDKLKYTSEGAAYLIKNNIMYVVLNTQDCGYKVTEKNKKYWFETNPQGTIQLTVKQLNWFSNLLKEKGNTVSSIIVTTHIPVDTFTSDKLEFDMEKDEHAVLNIAKVKEIIQNYNNQKKINIYQENDKKQAVNPTSETLSGNYAKIQLLLSGHIHKDRLYEGTGTNSFSACCSMNIEKGKLESDDVNESGEGYIPRVEGKSAQKTNLKIIIFSETERKIKVLNFGYQPENMIDNHVFNFV